MTYRPLLTELTREVIRVAERRGIDRDHMVADARRRQLHPELRHAVAAPARLVDQREDRAVVRDDVLHVDAAQRRHAALEELLRRRVQVGDVVGPVDRHDRYRQGCHDGRFDRLRRRPAVEPGDAGWDLRHAAILSAAAS